MLNPNRNDVIRTSDKSQKSVAAQQAFYIQKCAVTQQIEKVILANVKCAVIQQINEIVCDDPTKSMQNV